MSEPLLPLPVASYFRREARRNGGYNMVPAYTAAEMRSYALACGIAHHQPVQAAPWREMIEATKEVFSYDSPETPQTTRDVIEYVKSYLEVYVDKASGITVPSNMAKALESEWEQRPPKLQPAPKEWAGDPSTQDYTSTQPEQQAPALPWMDVRKILLDVVPGEDGMGLEVYAKSTVCVERKLTEMGERIEELESKLTAHPPAQPQPVGHVMRTGKRADGKPWVDASFKQDGSSDLPDGTPLFAHPPAQPQPRTLREGEVMGTYMDFDRTADPAWTSAEYLTRFGAFISERTVLASALLNSCTPTAPPVAAAPPAADPALSPRDEPRV